jgi:hypothetical protein
VFGRIADEAFQSSIMSSLLLSKVEPLRGGTQCRESRRFFISSCKLDSGGKVAGRILCRHFLAFRLSIHKTCVVPQRHFWVKWIDGPIWLKISI